ncbi:MAG TPA: TerC family protein [Pseudolabrys sp.]|nr:TerC family protein [Pseudolabrys sp.]
MTLWGTDLSSASFWLSVLQVIWINILLSGDNAVVIALACRGLPPRERLWGMIIGAGFASVLLVIFTGVISLVLTLPYLKLAGAIALFWIAVKLLAPQAHDAEDTPEAAADLWRAVRLVVVADIVMSFDNVLAVAAVAKGDYLLLAAGLSVSIPMVIGGSAVILALLGRLPILVWGGAAILGWVAGGLFASDPVTLSVFDGFEPAQVDMAAQFIGAVFVVVCGYIWRRRHHAALNEA